MPRVSVILTLPKGPQSSRRKRFGSKEKKVFIALSLPSSMLESCGGGGE
jgi:hypothetical protein